MLRALERKGEAVTIKVIEEVCLQPEAPRRTHNSICVAHNGVA